MSNFVYTIAKLILFVTNDWISFFLVQFEVINGFGCKENGKRYGSLYEAKSDCSLDSECSWILNKNYYNISFYLCAKDDNLVEMKSSCVYEKFEKHGKFNTM